MNLLHALINIDLLTNLFLLLKKPLEKIMKTCLRLIFNKNQFAFLSLEGSFCVYSHILCFFLVCKIFYL